MTAKKVWFITGAGRGMGVDIAKAALAAGNAGRRHRPQHRGGDRGRRRVRGPAGREARRHQPRRAPRQRCEAAVERFGRIDVLVNNAGNFYAGFFEEITPEDFRAQVETNLFGPLNVTRAVLPVMRAQRSGLVVTISSTAGITGQEFVSAYAAVEVRRRGLDRVADPRGRAVRHPHDARRAGLLPHRAAHAGVDELCRAHDRRLRRENQADRHCLEQHERQAGRRPRQARRSAGPARRARTSHRCAGPPAPTPWRPSSRRPRPCSPRPTPTATCPRRWRSTRPGAEGRSPRATERHDALAVVVDTATPAARTRNRP